jgi:hypothetical protein
LSYRTNRERERERRSRLDWKFGKLQLPLKASWFGERERESEWQIGWDRDGLIRLKAFFITKIGNEIKMHPGYVVD